MLPRHLMFTGSPAPRVATDEALHLGDMHQYDWETTYEEHKNLSGIFVVAGGFRFALQRFGLSVMQYYSVTKESVPLKPIDEKFTSATLSLYWYFFLV